MGNYIDSFNNQLSYFSNKVVKRGPPASEEMILTAEKQLSCQFSPQLKEFLKHHNGVYIAEVFLMGVPSLDPRKRLVFFSNLVKANSGLRDICADWPNDWLLLGEDGFGNYYIASLHRTDEQAEYPILFVDHETLEVEYNAFARGYFDLLEKITTQMQSLYLPDGTLRNLTPT